MQEQGAVAAQKAQKGFAPPSLTTYLGNAEVPDTSSNRPIPIMTSLTYYYRMKTA